MNLKHGFRQKVVWPNGASFAFTVFDDTDCATLANNRPIYEFLFGLGIRTTKSVWVKDGESPPSIPGVTCDDKDYLAWLIELQDSGFEIAWHNATWETSCREATLLGLERFKELFGHDPVCMANHAENKEGIYWGADRLSGWRRLLLGNLIFRVVFGGHKPTSPFFWGDACRERIRYVRNFTFRGIDTLGACPLMPYYDPDKPYVSRWFSSSAGADVTQFNELISPENVEFLERCGGACIVYTHFGKGFVRGSEIDSLFCERMTSLTLRNGWFPTVAELLDYLVSLRGEVPILNSRERRNLEMRWLVDRILHSLQMNLSIT